MEKWMDGWRRANQREGMTTGPGAAMPLGGAAMVFLGVSTCASGGQRDGAPRSNSPVITTGEIAYRDEQGVLDLAHPVELARPSWLRPPTGHRSVCGSADPVTVVFRDGRNLGGLGELEVFLSAEVRELRWGNAAEADALPGTGNRHVHGAIAVINTAGVGAG